MDASGLLRLSQPTFLPVFRWRCTQGYEIGLARGTPERA
jgi:hypothetical protein